MPMIVMPASNVSDPRMSRLVVYTVKSSINRMIPVVTSLFFIVDSPVLSLQSICIEVSPDRYIDSLRLYLHC